MDTIPLKTKLSTGVNKERAVRKIYREQQTQLLISLRRNLCQGYDVIFRTDLLPLLA